MQKTKVHQDNTKIIGFFTDAVNTLKSRSMQLSSKIEDVIAMQRLPELNKQIYIPWTDSAIRPAALLLVLNEISIHRRQFIVECGTGISTLYISKLIEKVNAQLISIDHDPKWQKVVEDQAKDIGVILDKVQFISAPLVECTMSLKANHWYDTLVIDRELPDGEIDLLLVDAPIAFHPSIEESRFPALPFFRNRLAHDFSIFLDDCHRRGEQSIAKTWIEQYNLEGRFYPERGNVCHFFPANAKRYNIV